MPSPRVGMFSAILFTTIFSLLPCSTALPSTPSLSKTPNHHLGKRVTPVLECSPQAQIPDYPNPVPGPLAENDPARPFVEQVRTFKSLTSLCGTYPSGMGYYCPPHGGALLLQTPRSQLYDFLGPPDAQYLKDACQENCYCPEIAPDEPGQASSKPASAQCLAAVGESDSEEECEETFNDPLNDDGIYCDVSGYLYGRPADADCKLAQDGIGGEEADSLTETHEFLGVGAEPMYNGFPIAQTPYNWTSGTCYIQLSMLENIASSNLENWDHIYGRVEALRRKCVAGLGVGGSVTAGDVSAGERQGIGIFVSGVDSRNKQMLDMKFGCIADADGNYSCEDESAPPSKKQKTSSPPSSSDSGATGNRLSGGAQSGTCAHHKDCDYKNGYTCARTKTAADDFPVHSTWGTFTCTLASKAASGVVAAAAAAYISLGSTCRGRCMLDSNGTFNILANTTATGPEPDSAMGPMLVGPCNCTYVSAACVLSTTGTVFEDPGARIDTVVGAPNGNVCCDGSTGLWRNSTVLRDSPAKDPMCPPAPAPAAAAAGEVSGQINSRGRHGGAASGFGVVLTT